MISPSLRARLSRIARGLAGAAPPPAPVAVDAAPAPAPPPPLTRPFLVRFDPESCGRERTDPAGACWEVRPPAETLAEDASDLLQARPAVPGGIVVDIETAGLAAAPLFLVGALWSGETGAPVVTQWLARDYTEEAAVLEAFAAFAAGRGPWVTFNGASFDLPYLADRRVYHRLGAVLPPEHLDLLPRARRKWQGTVADCRLKTLEQSVCGLLRCGDVDGSAIPDLYHEFARTRNWAIIAPVLHHNAMDLLTQARLWAALAQRVD